MEKEKKEKQLCFSGKNTQSFACVCSCCAAAGRRVQQVVCRLTDVLFSDTNTDEATGCDVPSSQLLKTFRTFDLLLELVVTNPHDKLVATSSKTLSPLFLIDY